MNKILVVEDDVVLRKEMCFLLKMEGFNVAEAENGEDGLKKFVDFQPDLILSDIRMPIMDGLEFLQKLRDEHPVLPIPFIFLSVLDKTEDIKKGLELGAIDYVTKPPDSGILFARIRRQLEQLALQRSHEQGKLRLKKAYEYSERLTELKKRVGKLIVDRIGDKLTVMSGNAQQFRKETDELLIQAESLNNIVELLFSIQKMKRMTDKIVDSTQMVKEGLDELLKEMTTVGVDVDIRIVLANVLASRQFDAFIKHINFPYPPLGGGEQFLVKADEHLVEKSIDTILDFLINYTHQKGIIGVSLEKSDENGFFLKLNSDGLKLTDEQKMQIFCLPESEISSPDSDKLIELARMRIVKDDLFSQNCMLELDDDWAKGVGFKIRFPFSK